MACFGLRVEALGLWSVTGQREPLCHPEPLGVHETDHGLGAKILGAPSGAWCFWVGHLRSDTVSYRKKVDRVVVVGSLLKSAWF